MNFEISHIVLTVISDLSKNEVTKILLDEGFHVTEIGSTSSLFATGFSTLLIGVAEEQVARAVQIVRDHCDTAMDPGERRAVVYVLKTDTFGVFSPQEVTQ